MPDQSYLSMQGAYDDAVAGKAAMANCVMKCFQQGFSPTPNSTLADFLAAECDFDGYAPITIATWADPVLSGVGWSIFAPTQVFRWEHDTDDVGNNVGGFWLTTSGGHLADYTVFDPAVAMTGPGMAVIKTPVQFYPAG